MSWVLLSIGFMLILFSMYWMLIRGIPSQQIFEITNSNEKQTVLSTGVVGGDKRLFLSNFETITGHVYKELICNDDLLITDGSILHRPVKVHGDLKISGKVIFHQTVIVRGNIIAEKDSDVTFLGGVLCSKTIDIRHNAKLLRT